MMRLSLRRGLAAAVSTVAVMMALPSSAITLGQVDNFQSGGVANWGGSETLNVPNGGPGGMGDNALEVQVANRFVFYNRMQWSGNYIAAGVSRISMDVEHQNEIDLELRIGISKGVFGSGGTGDTYITNYSVNVPNDGQWHHLEFDIGPTDFVRTSANTMPPGPGDPAGALADVYELRILHRPIDGGNDDFSFIGEFMPGSMRVDNILAEAAAPPEDADFDDDGDVDGNDFLIWQRGLGAGTTMTGDADGDGTVDGEDLDIWEAQFGGAPIASAAAAIPEPSAAAMVLAGMGVVALAIARSRLSLLAAG